MFATYISIFILLSSAALLVLWLRSATQSVLNSRFEHEYSSDVAEANRLAFVEVRQAIQRSPEDLSEAPFMLTSLERDYDALTYLLRNAATVNVGRYTYDERLLVLDFQLLRVWVRAMRFFSPEAWRAGMLEMTTILEYFGNVVGQRLVAFPEPLSSQ